MTVTKSPPQTSGLAKPELKLLTARVKATRAKTIKRYSLKLKWSRWALLSLMKRAAMMQKTMVIGRVKIKLNRQLRAARQIPP
ncbi:hypothetical protein ME804_12390 [Lactobacillus delbrueckii]|nr:hypothetical protein ME798_16440 [Lactobacillus delbrueckii]GHN57199.1 hypothetical protein ME804_12390 [Lactobacillus delbrueckii]